MQTPPTRRQSSRLRGILAIASVYITLLVIVVLILHGGLPLFARNAQTAAPSPRPTTTAAPAPLRLTLPTGRYVVRLTNEVHDETLTVQVGETETVIEKSW